MVGIVHTDTAEKIKKAKRYFECLFFDRTIVRYSLRNLLYYKTIRVSRGIFTISYLLNYET